MEQVKVFFTLFDDLILFLQFILEDVGLLKHVAFDQLINIRLTNLLF